MTTTDIQLWPNQLYALEEIPRLIELGEKRICLTSPTGGGKSLIVCKLVEWALNRGWQAVVYTNRRLLIEQLAKVMANHGIEHGVRAADHDDERERPVQISSIQTENSRVYKRKKWATLHPAQLAIVDEAHLLGNGAAEKIINDHVGQGAAVLGVTATPLDLGHLYTKLVVAGTNSELRRCGALVPARHYAPDEPDLKHIKKYNIGEDLTEQENVKAIMRPGIFGRVLTWYKKLNPDQKPSILFAPGVKESIWFAEQFQKTGIRSAHIDGSDCWLDGKSYKTSQKAREDILAAVTDGSVRMVCNRFVLREGVDLPCLEFGCLATVIGSLQSYLQTAGRLLRACPETGKLYAILSDHGGNYHRHGSINSDRHWELDQTARIVSGLREEHMRQNKEQEPISCPRCKAVRKSGPVCPACGFESHAKSRMVVQIDGTLREVQGDIYKPRVTKTKANTLQLWTRMYHRAKNAGMTFRQAEGLFAVENYYWPSRDLPMMPMYELDLFRKVKDVPAERLIKK